MDININFGGINIYMQNKHRIIPRGQTRSVCVYNGAVTSGSVTSRPLIKDTDDVLMTLSFRVCPINPCMSIDNVLKFTDEESSKNLYRAKRRREFFPPYINQFLQLRAR